MHITRKHAGRKLSRVVVFNHVAYLCGQVAKDYSGDVAAQTREALERIDEHLAEVGTDKSNLLTATVYIKNTEDTLAMNEVWCAWLKDCPAPARTCVRADMANPDILVEITATAAVPYATS